MSGPSWKSWQAMEGAMDAAADAHAEGSFVHPGDLMDAADRPDQAIPASSTASMPAIGDVFARIMAACLPPRSYGEERRWRAGYYRMCALCYRLCPEMYEGMNQAEIAERLGITLAAFKKQLEHADDIIALRDRPRPAKPRE